MKNARSQRVVLVVEDDPLVRQIAVEIALDAGCETFEAAQADEAIALLETRRDIGVLFTDIEMPGGMDGLELAHVVRRRWPHVAILVASGQVRVAGPELPALSMFFTKPYSPTAVGRAIRSVTSQSA